MIWNLLVAAVFAAMPAYAEEPAAPRVVPTTAIGPQGMPPIRFRGNSVAIVHFTSQAEINRECGVPANPKNVIRACAKSINGFAHIYMPNPCPLGDSEWFALVMCHENGHRNGWSFLHED